MNRIRPFATRGTALALAVLALAPALAAEEVAADGGKLGLKVEIPRLNVAEYHRPYVAVWVQGPGGKEVVDLAVWYQVKDTGDEAGTKWLPDLRQWWRRSGRNQQIPVDAVTGPTPPTGERTVKIDADQLAKLPSGELTLVVEAVREVGDREILEIPFAWPPREAGTFRAQGKKELGEITLTVAP
jgi:hypothetical protein